MPVTRWQRLASTSRQCGRALYHNRRCKMFQMSRLPGFRSRRNQNCVGMPCPRRCELCVKFIPTKNAAKRSTSRETNFE